MIRRALGVAVALAGTLSAGGLHAHSEGAPDVFTPVPLDQQRVSGAFAERMRANVEGFLENVNPQELLARPTSAGLFLLAASDSYSYSEDPNLRKAMDGVAAAIVKDPPKDVDALGQASLISGLVAYSDETGREDALSAARAIADAHLRDAEAELAGPLTELYEASEEQRYLNAARGLVRKVPPEETLARFVFGAGLVEYYRATGDDASLRKSVEMWSRVHPDIAGAPDAEGNTCLTAAWFAWTTQLLRATGKIPYAEAAEVTLYNQLLAAQSPQSGAILGRVTLAGQKIKADYADACAAAEGWALAVLPESLWGRLDSGIAIFNYTPGRVSMRLHHRTTVQIYSEAGYPQTGDVLLHIEPSHPTRFHLLLRVPTWSHQFTVESSVGRQIGKPGQFLDLAADWKKGDTVRISMDMPVSLITDPQQPELVALKRGPQVLALTGPASGGGLNGVTLDAKDTAVSAVSAASEQQYQAKGFNNDAAATLSLVPFGSVSGDYRVWVRKH